MLYGGHRGVAVYMYRLVVWRYTNISNMYICYREIHGVYGGHRGVSVYLYRLVVWGYTNISNMYMC